MRYTRKKSIKKKVNRIKKKKGGSNVPMKGGSNVPIKFGLLAIFKNEEMGIREWLQHYKWQGVDEIIMLNNNSTDGWKDKIKDLMDRVTIIDAPKPHAQIENYKVHGLPVLKKLGINVVTILDLDEYMFGTDGKNLKQHIVEIFGNNQRPSLISYRWTQFGSSGFIKQPESIRKSFIWKVKDTDAYFRRMGNLDASHKSIFWLDDIVELDQHTPTMKPGAKILSLQASPKGIQLNHYRVQSEEFYKGVKMTRGDVFHSPEDIQTKPQRMVDSGLRSSVRFKQEDTNEVEDTQLRDLVEKYEKEIK